MTASSLHDNRGTNYADGGIASTTRVFHPDPEKIKRFHQEWEGITGYLDMMEWEMDCD